MKVFTVYATRYGFATVTAETEEEAYDIARNMDESEYDWSDVDEISLSQTEEVV